MNPEQWKRIEEVFESALEIPAPQRQAFLERACSGDGELLREVESLLAADAGHCEAIQTAISAQALDLAVGGEALVGKRLGVWRLTGVIGHGGMGTVYKAVRDDQAFEKEAALKLIRRGMDTDLVVSSFRRERQILARLDHPYIARLLDGGATEDGLPYFVMEQVEGKPITEYCAENQLSVPQRLRLFRDVCAAVQYAHQNLVVHRDLKPGNIFVTREGTPKLLDFGVAKLVNPETASVETMTGIRMLTPDYASPEQVRGEPVTTATDIYSLGVVLYELLTSHRPHEVKSGSWTDLQHKICLTEPEAPSTTVRGLKGDLDNIVLMALRKEPARRYATAEQFGEDIRRYMAGLPIRARKDTLFYRTRKFVRRNRWGALAAAVTVLSLIIGTVVATVQARRAEFQAERAERRFQEVRKLAKTMLFDVNDKIRTVPGAQALEARDLLIKTGFEYLNSLAGETQGDTELQRELAEGYIQIGIVEAGGFDTRAGRGPDWAVQEPGFGRLELAMKSCQKALAILEQLRARDPSDRRLLDSLITTHYYISQLTPDSAQKMEILGKGIQIADSIQPPITSAESRSLGFLLNAYALEQLNSGEPQAALATFRRANNVVAWSSEPWVLYLMGDLTGSLESCIRCIRGGEASLKRYPNDQLAVRAVRRGLVSHHLITAVTLGNPIQLNLGKPDRALPYARKALELAREVAASNSNADLFSLNNCYLNLAALLRDSDPIRAVEACRRAMLEGRIDPRHWNPGYPNPHRAIAYPLRKLGRRKEALAELQKALELERKNSTASSLTHNEMGDLLLDMGDRAGALEQYRRAVAIAENVVEKKPRVMPYRQDLADCYERLGAFHAGAREWDQAREWYGKSLVVWKEWTQWGVSSPYNLHREKKAAQAITRCDAALEKK